MVKLQSHVVEKPWGRTDLPPTFENTSTEPVGEVWFDAPAGQDLPLLVKYIFTSEKLSVQVHPNDEQAHARGLARGKNECWYILDAQEGSSLGLGLHSAVSADELRNAAVDGSIEHLMDWKPVAAGDFFYVPAGTIHAIGAGITLLEVQQNSDVTYRLYDYGRPRELHLDDGIAVAKPERLCGLEQSLCRRTGRHNPGRRAPLQLDPSDLHGRDSALSGFTPKVGHAANRRGEVERRRCDAWRMSFS